MAFLQFWQDFLHAGIKLLRNGVPIYPEFTVCDRNRVEAVLAIIAALLRLFVPTARADDLALNDVQCSLVERIGIFQCVFIKHPLPLKDALSCYGNTIAIPRQL